MVTYRPEKTGGEIDQYIDRLISLSGIPAKWLWKAKHFDDGGFCYSPGCCYTNQKLISISKKFCENNFRFHKDEIDQLISHELAHIKFPNHSKEFKKEQVLIYAKLIRGLKE